MTVEFDPDTICIMPTRLCLSSALLHQRSWQIISGTPPPSRFAQTFTAAMHSLWPAQSLLKATSHRLAQLQERKHSQSQITRRDIATLLNAGNASLARAKAQNLVRDEVMGDVLGVLETCVGVLHERMGELESDRPG